MGYKDKEEAKMAARERKRKQRERQKSVTEDVTRDVTGVTNVTRDVTSNRFDLIEGELRLFREAFGSINDLLKQNEDLKGKVIRLRERIEILEGEPQKTFLVGRRGNQKTKSIERQDEDSGSQTDDNRPWRTEPCAKHGRGAVLGRWVCCGE